MTVADINSAERAVERDMLMEIVNLKRGLGVLATVGATAPFVGLLGTTMGIVNAFTGMAGVGLGRSRRDLGGCRRGTDHDGVRSARRHSGGVGVQLLPTKIDNLTAEMTYSSKEMIDYLIKGVSGEFGRSRFTREFNTAAPSGTPDLAVELIQQQDSSPRDSLL